MSLKGKHIILGVSGSIAAYKAAYLVRLLRKAGAEVRVLMTQAATAFISPLTLATLSLHDVVTSVHDGESWNNHVELGLWADALVIAPTTATTLGKLANAICDNPIVAVYLSARCPVFFAPAMDLDMWAHPATQRNVRLLQSYGNHLISPGEGELASGLQGPGRLAEPEEIVAQLAQHFTTPTTVAQDFAGKHLLVTAGPTFEDLDPVRFLGNRSTGRMGIALAEAAAARGATVELLLGPTALAPASHGGITLRRVRSAREMHAHAVAAWPRMDAAILAAAVADYRPAQVADQKIKKKEGPLALSLVRNPDIAATLGREKQAHQRLVGFALETEKEVENARAKLERKNLDFIVLNSPNDAGAAFGHTTNRIQLVTHNKVTPFELKSKTEVALDILDALALIW